MTIQTKLPSCYIIKKSTFVELEPSSLLALCQCMFEYFPASEPAVSVLDSTEVQSDKKPPPSLGGHLNKCVI